MKTKEIFETDFKPYALAGDAIEGSAEGFDLVARIVYDEDYRLDYDDCHNLEALKGESKEVRDWVTKCQKAWLNEEWFYCGIVIWVYRNGVEISEHAASLWGIECNYPQKDESKNANIHLREVANEIAWEALETAESELERMREALV